MCSSPPFGPLRDICVVSAADRSFPNDPREPTCRRRLVPTDDELPTASPPLPHPSPLVGHPKLYARKHRILRSAPGSGDSSVSFTASLSQLNRETARSITVAEIADACDARMEYAKAVAGF